MTLRSQTVSSAAVSRDECDPRHRAWEHGLPGYLQHDLDAFKRGRAEGSTLLDCLWGELYGSINGAEIDDQAITHEHAEYLRDKFLRGKEV